MSRVLTKADNPSNVIKHVGVVVILNHNGSRHTAIAYKRDKQWRLLHLASHNKLMDDPVEDWEFLCINPEPGLLDIQLERVGAFCRLVWDRNSEGKIPYAFSVPSSFFDPLTGKLVVGPNKLGLTCASFVMTIFGDIGCPLILQSTWRHRKEDDHAARKLLQGIPIRSLEDERHVETALKDLPAFRFRPEEVAGAAACDIIPADFNASVEMSLKILSALGI